MSARARSARSAVANFSDSASSSIASAVTVVRPAWTSRSISSEHGRRMSHDGHLRVLRGLRAGSPDAAEAAMRVHLDEIADLAQRLSE
ncbi:FCD domain-containing protein [Microbacterium sp. NPDC016588]